MRPLRGRDAERGNVWLDVPALSLSRGPERVKSDEPATEVDLRPFLGFGVTLKREPGGPSSAEVGVLFGGGAS